MPNFRDYLRGEQDFVPTKDAELAALRARVADLEARLAALEALRVIAVPQPVCYPLGAAPLQPWYPAALPVYPMPWQGTSCHR